MTLRYPRTFKSIAWGALTVALIAVCLGWSRGEWAESPKTLVILLLFSCAFLIPTLLEFHRYWFRVNDQKIESQGIFFRKEIYWKDISKVRFSKFGNLVFEGPSASIRVNPLLEGFPGFARSVEPVLRPEVKGTAFDDLRRYRETGRIN
jgi:hypothetical protein